MPDPVSSDHSVIGNAMDLPSSRQKSLHKIFFSRSSGKHTSNDTRFTKESGGRKRGIPVPSMLHWVTSSERVYNFHTPKWMVFPIGGHSLPLNKLFLHTFKGSYGSIQFGIQASFLAVLSPTMYGFHLGFLFVFFRIKNEHMADMFFKVRFLY